MPDLFHQWRSEQSGPRWLVLTRRDNPGGRGSLIVGGRAFSAQKSENTEL
jgi:hypothetical protein